MLVKIIIWLLMYAVLRPLVVQWLWNWHMTTIFGLPNITYGTAFGLIMLAQWLTHCTPAEWWEDDQ